MADHDETPADPPAVPPAPWTVSFRGGLWEVTCSDGSLGGRFPREGDARTFADVAGPGGLTVVSKDELARLRDAAGAVPGTPPAAAWPGTYADGFRAGWDARPGPREFPPDRPGGPADSTRDTSDDCVKLDLEAVRAAVSAPVPPVPDAGPPAAADVPALLRLAASGRRDYAKSAPDDQAAVLLTQAATMESAARIAEGDRIPLHSYLPSWRWDEIPAAAPSAGTTALVLPEPDGMEAVEDDEGRAGSVPTWVLRSCTTLMDTVQAWPDGLDFEGGLIDSQSVIRDLEQDALKVLAAIATHRAARGRDSGRDAS